MFCGTESIMWNIPHIHIMRTHKQIKSSIQLPMYETMLHLFLSIFYFRHVNLKLYDNDDFLLFTMLAIH